MTDVAVTASKRGGQEPPAPVPVGGEAATGERRVAAVSLLASALLSVTGGIGLSVAFGWPAVLGEPAAVALPAFAEAEAAVRGWFVVMLFSSVVLVPGVLALHRLLAAGDGADGGGATGGGGSLLWATTAFGVVGAVVQTLGWVRWPLVVPALAERYLDPATPPETRAATQVAYDLLNQYAGGALGEHLGWLFQGLWAVGLSLLLLRARSLAPAWLRRSLPVLAIAWVATLIPGGWLHSGALEQTGTSLYSVWYVWTAVLGACLALSARRRREDGKGL